MSDQQIHYQREINTDYDKGKQLRFVVSDFKDRMYLHLRWYFQDYLGEWHPTTEGVGIEMTMGNTTELLLGLVDVCSMAEASGLLETALNKIKDGKPN